MAIIKSEREGECDIMQILVVCFSFLQLIRSEDVRNKRIREENSSSGLPEKNADLKKVFLAVQQEYCGWTVAKRTLRRC